MGINKTYVVCADGSGEVNYRLPRGVEDHPEWSPNGEWIVFDNLETAQTNESQLFLYHIPTKEKIIANEELFETMYPHWSPSGTEIVFDGLGGIYVMDVECIYNGKDCDFLPQFILKGFYPSWSYDGQYLTFWVNSDQIATPSLKLVNLDNLDNVIEIKPENASSCVDADWSPIENKLVARCATSSSDIFVFDFETGEYINLTEGSSAREGYPQWSPDGSQIAFITHRDEDLEDCFNIECSVSADELYVMDSDGSHSTRVTFETDEVILWFAWIPE